MTEREMSETSEKKIRSSEIKQSNLKERELTVHNRKTCRSQQKEHYKEQSLNLYTIHLSTK